MPVYVYRCLDCGLSHEVRHGFDETYESKCDGCGGVIRKYFGEVYIAASATPTRGRHDGKEIDWSGSKAKERTKEEDMAAYKRLRSDGVQPKSIDGSAHLERHAGSKWEVQSGTVLTGEKKDIRRKERNLDTVLGD